MGTICLSTRARARAGVRVFTGRRPERRGAEPYEHRLYSLATTSNNLLPHSAGFLRLGSPPTHSSVPERNPHAFLDTLFRILMPELILFLALLSGSLRDLLCVDERLRRRAERIRKVSLKGTKSGWKQLMIEVEIKAGIYPGWPG